MTVALDAAVVSQHPTRRPKPALMGPWTGLGRHPRALAFAKCRDERRAVRRMQPVVESEPSVPAPPAPAVPSATPQTASADRSAYPRLLDWGFALFNSTRVLTYLPTIWAIWQSHDSSQHSILTWVCWTAANAVMAAWLYEHQQRRLNRAIVVNIANAVMCMATVAVIGAFR